MGYIQKYIGSYVIVRTQMSGIYAGFLSSQEGSEVCLKSARMIYSWEGAATIIQAAVEGIKKNYEKNCKLTVEIQEVCILDAISILPCEQAAQECLIGIEPWKA